jgi:hypothetical protein
MKILKKQNQLSLKKEAWKFDPQISHKAVKSKKNKYRKTKTLKVFLTIRVSVCNIKPRRIIKWQ